MNLAFKINGEFLDLNPNTVLELEEENPFLQLGSEIQGQYSLPLTLPNSEKNARLLGHPNLLYTTKSNTGIDVICYFNGIQHSQGQLKLEGGQSNINNGNQGSISVYYLFGVSDFYKYVETVYLTDVSYGDDYTISKGDYDANGDGTFFDYMMYVMENGTPNTHNYSLFPIINTAGLTANTSSDCVLNCITHNPHYSNIRASLLSYQVDENSISVGLNEFCPFIYLSYCMQQVFKHVGWTVQGAVFSDNDFSRISILNNVPIDWYGPYQRNESVTFNLKNHVPRIKVGTFLIGLQNRFGWWYDFDYRKKVCTISYRKDVFKNRTRKEMTNKAGANYSYKINTSDTVYSLTQTGGDQKPDFSQLNYQGVISNSQQLPSATSDRYYHYYFVSGENAFYFCNTDESNNHAWERIGENNFDFSNSDQSTSIPTCCLIPGSNIEPLYEITLGGLGGTLKKNIDRDVVYPVVDLMPEAQEVETFYICYQQGLQPSMNDNGLPEILFPMGGAGCHDLHGGLIRSMALSFEYKGNDGQERGIYSVMWQYFLDYMRNREEVTIPINFTVTDLINFKYTDTILIRNVEYFIKNPHFSLPIKGFTSAELVRI